MRPDGPPGITAKPPTARLFFALWPEPELAARLAEHAATIATRYHARPMRRDTIHLTLHFLGDVAETAVPQLVEAGASVRAAPFVLNIDRLAVWQHNHLLWAGCRETPAALPELVGALRAALVASGGPVGDVRRPFTPHLTLVRKLPAAAEPFVLPQIEATRWPCSRFVLVRSRLSAQGPDYQTIAEFPLVP